MTSAALRMRYVSWNGLLCSKTKKNSEENEENEEKHDIMPQPDMHRPQHPYEQGRTSAKQDQTQVTELG